MTKINRYVIVKEIYGRNGRRSTTLGRNGLFGGDEPHIFESRESAEQMRGKIDSNSRIYLCEGDTGGFYVVRKYAERGQKREENPK